MVLKSYPLYKRVYLFVIAAGLCLWASCLHGQALRFKHLTVEDGLSQNSVLSIQQDSLGYLWFGTQNGLNRYNGYEFETFETSNHDTLSLPSNFINSLQVDGKTRMWIGTSKGLCLWDQEYARFLRMDKYFENDSLNGQYDFWDILIDHEGAVWLLGEAQGFHIFRKKKEESLFKKLLTLHEPSDNTILDLYGQLMEDETGNVWVGTSKSGLWIYKRKENRFLKLFLAPRSEYPVTGIVQDKQGAVWIGTAKNGLYRWNSRKAGFDPVQGLNDSAIRSMYIDRQGRFWIGTDRGGLNLYDQEKKKFSFYDHDIANPGTLLHNSVWSIFQDRQNILWVGTYAGGINYYDPNTPVFRLFQAGTSEYHLSNNTVTGFAEDRNGNVWIGTDRGGLNLFDYKKKTFRHFRHKKNSIHSISSDVIQHLLETSQNELWIATWLGGLNYLDKKTFRFTRYLHDPDDPRSISSNTINYIFEDSGENLWLGTSMGADLIDHRYLGKGSAPAIAAKHFQHDKNLPSSITNNYVKAIYEDTEGRLWLGTQQGLNLYDAATNSFQSFRNNPSGTKIFTKDYILCISQDNKGNFLLGTNENGLLYYDQRRNKLTVFNKRNGFSSNTVFGMVEDAHGIWWISTNDGLVKVRLEENSFTVYNRYDGLQSNEFKSNAYHKLSTGELLFGGINGFNLFHPDSIPKNTTPPSLAFSRLKLFNKVIIPEEGSPLKQDLSLTQNFELNHDQSFIGIEFTALNFTVPQKNQYAFKLEGVDEDWNYAGAQRSVSYSYLSPGHYTFKVKAANNDGVWSKPRTLSIVIHPPWWNTLWFKSITAVMLTALLWGGYKMRTRQLHERKKILEQTVRNRTAELQQKNHLLSERQEEILHQKEEIQSQRDNLEQQYHTIQTLSEIGQKITASLKKDELLERIYSMINKLIDAPLFSIGHRTDHDTVEFATISNYSTHIQEDVLSMNDDGRLSILSMKTRQVILLNDIDAEIGQYPVRADHYKTENAANAAIYVPLFSMDKEVTGVLIVKNSRTHCYTPTHLNMLKNLAAYIGIAFDNASVYKEIEAQSEILVQQSAKLKELDAIKTRFFINISHEFRTPLTLIVSPLEQILACEKPKDWPKMRHQLEVMNKNAKQLLRLINELLELRNIESGAYEFVATENDLVAFINTIMEQFEDLANRHQIRFELSTPDEEILFWFDRKMMEKVFINIYSNAFKYTLPGGVIKTLVERKDEQGKKQIEIRISDTGAGIPEHELHYIFERFYQGKDPINTFQESTGIGLSFVKDLVALHGGRIDVQSKVDEGTTFTIILPMDNEHLSLSQPRKNAEEMDSLHPDIATPVSIDADVQPPLQGTTSDKALPIILIIEDNTDLRDFLKTSLERDFNILQAEHGQKGLALALQYVPDLIVSDVMMPVMDGIQLCMNVKSDQRISHVPVILLTARSGEESEIQGLDTGADDYITKPFNANILLARIRNLISTRKKLHTVFSSKEFIEIRKVVASEREVSFLEAIEKVIKVNVKDPSLNHELLAREVGMSKTQLYRKLQALTGKTVHEYIRNYRLKCAHEMLQQYPDKMIFEVAYDLGFKDHAYFSKSFHTFYGIWPKDVKKNHPHPAKTLKLD